jgi:hypothetical protein
VIESTDGLRACVVDSKTHGECGSRSLSRRSCVDGPEETKAHAMRWKGKTPHPVSMVRQPHASRQVSVCGRDDPWLHIGWSGAHCSPNIDLSDTPPGGFSVVARLIPGA